MLTTELIKIHSSPAGGFNLALIRTSVKSGSVRKTEKNLVLYYYLTKHTKTNKTFYENEAWQV